MSDLRPAAQQALETCTDAVAGWESLAPLAVRQAAMASLDALRAALSAEHVEQPEQEPVEPLKGWKLNHARKHPDEEGVAEIGYLDPEDDRFAPILTVDTGLYYQDAQALPLALAILSMLSAHPPRREWRGLTEEELHGIWSSGPEMMDYGRAIEAALKERNA